MHAVRIDTTIDQAAVAAIPALRPLLGRKVELIALDVDPQAKQEPENKKIDLDEFLATRPKWPADRPPVTLEDMENAIVQGALKSAGT